MSQTTVNVTYTASQNVSITRKAGVITKVTLWTSGNTAKQTQRIV